MINPLEIWAALDRLAAQRGLSASALARYAGLDPTTFNKSKRTASDGRARWPSTESLAKVLAAFDMSFTEFGHLIDHHRDAQLGRSIGMSVPIINMAVAGDDTLFDTNGYPILSKCGTIKIPGVQGETIFALQISGDTMQPLFRHGDQVVVSPGETIARGDRVVVRTRAGEIIVKELIQMSADSVRLAALNPDYPERKIALTDIAWVSKIIWVTQ